MDEQRRSKLLKDPPALPAGAGGQHRSQPGESKRAKPATLRTEQALRHQATIEVVYFGKRHVFTPAEFKKKAERVKRCLLIDHDALTFRATILRSGLEGLTPPWFIGATTAVTEAPRRLWALLTADEQRETTTRWNAQVEALRTRIGGELASVESRLSKLDVKGAVDEHAMLVAGIELAELRRALEELDGKASELQADVLRQAESGEAFVKGVADACLELALLLRPPMAPGLARDFQEVTYRLAYMVVEAGVQGLSAAATGSSFQNQLLSVLRSRLPEILQRLLAGTLLRWLSGAGDERVRAVVTDELAALCVDALAWALEDRPLEDLQALVEDRVFSALGKLVGTQLSRTSTESATERWARAIAQKLVEVVVARAGAVRRAAAERGVPAELLWVEEAPGLIAELLKQLLMDLASASVTSRRPPPSSPRNSSRLEDLWRKGPRLVGAAKGGKGGRTFTHLDRAQAQTLAQRMGLTRFHLERLRRVAFDHDFIMVVRRSSPLAHRHVDHPGREPKPQPLKAKTSKEGPLAGLVVIDDATPPPSVRAMGCLVRFDGLVFHPRMVESWARSVGRSDPAVRALMDLLQASAAEGQHGGFVEPSARTGEVVPGMAARIASVPEDLRGEVAALHAQLVESGPKVGYYSDLDFYELLDAKSGDRIPLGAPGDPRVQEAAANLARLNAAIKGSGPDASERPALVQHGGASEARHADGRAQFAGHGDLVVIDANGQVLPLDAAELSPTDRIRLETKARGRARRPDEYEARLQELVDDYQNERIEARVERYLQVRLGPTYKTLETRHLERASGGGSAPPIEPPKLSSPVASALPTLPRRFTTRFAPLPPVRPLDLQASAVVRGLFLVHPHNSEFLSGLLDADAIDEAWGVQTLTGGVIAMDAARENVVLSASAPGVDEALQRLARLAQPAARASRPLRAWYELVAPAAFTTSRQIMGILPDAHAKLPELVGELGRRASFATPPSERHGFVAFRAAEALEKGAVYSGDLEAVPARRLDIVWDPGLGAPWYIRPVRLADRPVAVHYGPLVRPSVSLSPGEALVAPAWRHEYPLDTPVGLAAALVALGLLEPAEPGLLAAIEDAVKHVQAEELELEPTGVLDDRTRDALRRRLAEKAGDGIVSSLSEVPSSLGWPSLDWPVPGHTQLNRADKKGEGGAHFGAPRDQGRTHRGIDIEAPVGAPVVAVAAGTARVPPKQDGSYGKWVFIEHGGGRVSTYAHLDVVLVRDGQRMARGEGVGKVGRTGNTPKAGDSHLHFELREGPGEYNGMKAIDPMPLLGTRAPRG